MDIFHACVIRCPRGQRQKNRHLIIACHFSQSAALYTSDENPVKQPHAYATNPDQKWALDMSKPPQISLW